jgi:hypothetical protein
MVNSSLRNEAGCRIGAVLYAPHPVAATLASVPIEAQPQVLTGARHGEALPELFAER